MNELGIESSSWCNGDKGQQSGHGKAFGGEKKRGGRGGGAGSLKKQKSRAGL